MKSNCVKIRRITKVLPDGRPAYSKDDTCDEIDKKDDSTLESLLKELFTAQQTPIEELENWNAKPIVNGVPVKLPMDTPAAAFDEVLLCRKGG